MNKWRSCIEIIHEILLTFLKRENPLDVVGYIKLNMSNGEVKRYKVRLDVKGYNQLEGLDYEETFSPLAKIVTLRRVIFIVVNHS